MCRGSYPMTWKMPRFTKHLLPSGQRLSLSLKDEYQGIFTGFPSGRSEDQAWQRSAPRGLKTKGVQHIWQCHEKDLPFPPFLSIDCLISTSVVKIIFLLVFGGDFYFNKRKWGKRDAQSARQIMVCKQEDLIRSVSSTNTSVTLAPGV